jgi:hypothetical protein
VRFVPDLLTRNTNLKLAALGLAVLLWVAVRIDAPARQTVSNVEVDVVLADPDWALDAAPEPRTVAVHFEGTTRDLLGVARDRPTIVIPVDQVYSRDTTLSIARDWVRSEGRATGSVAGIEPSAIRLSFERVETMTAPFSAQLTGQLPEALALAGPVTTVPRMARLRGPLRLLGNLTDVPLERFDLSQVQGSASYTVAVLSGPVEGLTVSPDSVTLVIPVEDAVERVLGPMAVEVVGSSAGASASPDSVTVRVRGARSLVGRIDPGALRVIATTTPEATDVGILPVRIEGLPDLVEAEADPPRVAVRLAVAP